MMKSNRICGQHRIEDRVQVKLLWDDVLGRWYLDPPTDPPHTPLDGSISPDERGMECDCPRTDTLPGPGYTDVPEVERHAREQHEAVLDRAAETPLPTREESFRMLAECFGLTNPVRGSHWAQLIDDLGQACDEWDAVNESDDASSDDEHEKALGVVEGTRQLLDVLTREPH